jgi:predicted MFS family arabinose efflux permease
MIACDVIRAALVLVMAVPRMPLAALVALLFVVTLAGAPFSSARAAIFPDVLSGEMYVMGTAVTVTTYQFAQVIGYAVRGTLVGFFGVRTSLLIDAATFIASALIVRAWVRARPAATAPGSRHESSGRAGIFTGVRLVLARPALRTPMFFGLLAAFYNAPEGVAAPLAHDLGGGAAAVGVILAANALGQTVGTITFSRFVAPATRLRFMGPLAISACAVLVLFFWKPDLYVSLLILFASGLCACYQLAANSAFVSAAPQEQRSQAFGLAQGAMSLGQGVVMILAGAAAEHHAPARAITVCGAVGVVAALAVTVGAARDRGWLAGKRHQRALSQVQLLSRMAGLLWRAARGVVPVGSSGPVVVAHYALLSRSGGRQKVTAQVQLLSRTMRSFLCCCAGGAGRRIRSSCCRARCAPSCAAARMVPAGSSGPVVVAHSGTPFRAGTLVRGPGVGDEISAGDTHAGRNISLCTHLNPLSD